MEAPRNTLFTIAIVDQVFLDLDCKWMNYFGRKWSHEPMLHISHIHNSNILLTFKERYSYSLKYKV
jgi:hypothetical protein